MSDTPVVVVSGYLGAGKTTFINSILRGASARITVLVNDFGSVNIDASLIANANGDTIELTNGCVCCAVGDDLSTAMLGIIESGNPPDMVIIETSGVADPRITSTYAHIRGLRTGGIIVLVDHVNFASQTGNRLISSTVERQVAAADLLLVTKANGSPVDSTAHSLRSINPSAPVMTVEECDVSVLTGVNMSASSGGAGSEPHETRHHARIERPSLADRAEALAWLGSLGPHVVRVKGVVSMPDGNHLVERVGLHCSAVPTDIEVTDGIVVITV